MSRIKSFCLRELFQYQSGQVRLQDSPPAAGRFEDMIPYRRSATRAERF